MLNKVRTRAGALLAATLLIQGGFQALTAQEANIKIAVVDLERVFVLSEAGKGLQGQLAAFQTQVQTEGEKMAKELNDLRQRAIDGGQSLSEDKLSEMQKAIEDKNIAIRRFRDDTQREGEKMKNEGLALIEQQLEPIFKQVRDELGLDLILNNVPGIVVMANEKVDITGVIVERLNASGSGG